MLESLSNIFRIVELRNKIAYTLLMFVIFRAGIHIPVPGVDASAIESLFNSGSLFGLLDLFAGGALSKFSIFAMSITPYINASIIMQLLQAVVPTFEEWKKDEFPAWILMEEDEVNFLEKMFSYECINECIDYKQ